MSTPIYLSAKEAAAELGVQPATLYAYVSRGLIRSVAGPGRQRRYDAGDVRRLQVRNDSAETGTPIVQSAQPVLETELTLISEEEGPIYRGQPARELAYTSTLESVATLLWECHDDPFDHPIPDNAPPAPPGLAPLDRLVMALAAWPLQDKAAYTQSPKLLQIKGAALLRYAVSALLGTAPSSEPIHLQLAGALGVAPAHRNILRAALVLSADHELNTSAYSARCAASIRAPLHSALIAALGAFAGPKHGAAPDRVSAWLSEINPNTNLEEMLSSRLQRGEPLPGFGMSLYKEWDPRAAVLVAILQDSAKDVAFVQRLPGICTAGADYYGAFPNIDFALAATERALALPPGSAKLVFCAGRMVGWIAHVLEQYRSEQIIRPRASYVGKRPK